MGEARTMHIDELGSIYPPEVINDALRALPRELQDWLGWLFFGELDTGHGVHGFKATRSGLDVTIGRGAGLVRNNLAPTGASKWAWVYMAASQVRTVAARHATLDRIDTFSVRWTSDPDTTVNVGFEGDVPDNVETQRGCQATIIVTTGTPTGPPTPPATPSGDELLWHVLVPSTADGGALVLYDRRRPLPGPKRRTREEAIVWDGFVTDTLMAMASFNARAEPTSGAPTWASGHFYNLANDWPSWVRGKPGAGELAGVELFPLMAPYDRTWWRTFPFMGYEQQYLAGSSSDLRVRYNNGVAFVDRLTTNAASLSMVIALPLDVRGLEIVSAKICYRFAQDFDNPSNVDVFLTGQGVGSDVNLGDFDIHAAAVVDTFGGTDYAKVFSVTPTITSEDVFYKAQVRVNLGGGANTNGELRIYGVALMFREGRG